MFISCRWWFDTAVVHTSSFTLWWSLGVQALLTRLIAPSSDPSLKDPHPNGDLPSTFPRVFLSQTVSSPALVHLVHMHSELREFLTPWQVPRGCPWWVCGLAVFVMFRPATEQRQNWSSAPRSLSAEQQRRPKSLAKIRFNICLIITEVTLRSE